jgi:hypothetical protein
VSFLDGLARDGFAIVSNLLDWSDVEALRAHFESVSPGEHGVRNILDHEMIRSLSNSPKLRGLVDPVLGPDAMAVRGIFFDKLPGANWKVPWHQDLTIAVAERHDVDGYGPWSVKEGIPHVQPPLVVLEQTLAVRVHLDDCSAENGALRVIPGSHSLGKLTGQQIDELAGNEPVICEARAGDALLMRPLLLHSSSPAAVPIHRRVVHLEYSSARLADPLVWHER